MHTPQTRWLPVILAALSAIGPFSVDTYLPAFHAMSAGLGATQVELQQTMTVYMASFAVMVLWHGSLSDQFGRRPVLIITTLLYALASVICALAPSVEWLWVGRCLQGLSAGAGMVVGRAVIIDLYAGAQAQKMMAQVMLIFGIAPAIAPLVGGVLLDLFGWRSIFVFLTLLGVTLAWLCWRVLPETLTPEARRPFAPLALAHAYREVLTHPAFMLLSVGMSMLFIGYFLYVVSSPVFIREHLGLDSPYAMVVLFMPAVICMMIGSALSARLAGRWSARRTIGVGLVIMASASVVEIALAASPLPGLWLLVPISLYNFGVALVMPTLSLISLSLFPERRGLASSCQAFVQVSVNAITAAAAPLLWGTSFSLALSAGACYLFALFVLWIWARQGRVAPK
jgi:DHA1 family bicyclomycin/chloramphenicol resistance-like MFS transporter